ncbi:hypothetical protein ACJMK2_031682 [Sinanodonta woodiana]|uniref:Uncharacterized protein n=1 Tax=Sinanodonta woodiana TaxID=1069815 RepID=A0ABD3WZH6_SINWO
MAISKVWTLVIFMVSLTEITGSIRHECNTDVIDAIVAKTAIIGSWSLNNATLDINVHRKNTIRFGYRFNEKGAKLASDIEGRLIFKACNGSTNVSLMFEDISREDEGEYGMELFFKIGWNDADNTRNAEYGLQLNVIEEDEITYGFDGDNMVTELKTTTEYFLLYHYEKAIATVNKSGCWWSEKSTVYGRLRCDSKDDIYTISINNVTQMDTGLYKIQGPMNSSSIHRWFFNISLEIVQFMFADKPTHGKTGDNVVIGWFYTQTGINCIVRVIHPYEGEMMLVPSNNVPHINSNVRHRLLYSGDVSRNYMSFKLLNVIASDAGFYIIESLYETIIPGRKQLIVEDSDGVVKGYSTELNISTSTSQSNTTDSVPWNMRVFDMAVVVGVVVLFLFTLGSLIRIQHKNTHRLESVQRFVVDKLNAVSFAMPSTIRRYLPTPPTPVANWFQEPNPDQTEIIGLHYTEIYMNEHREETRNQIEKEPNYRVQEFQSEVNKGLFASEIKRLYTLCFKNN